MDPVKKAALDLIEDNVHRLSTGDAGYHLILVVADYIEEGDLNDAIRILNKVDHDYFDNYLPDHVTMDEQLAKAVALIIDTFGLHFMVLNKPTGSA